jgi:hypothetical protein
MAPSVRFGPRAGANARPADTEENYDGSNVSGIGAGVDSRSSSCERCFAGVDIDDNDLSPHVGR